MADKPKVMPGDWVDIGQPPNAVEAVVNTVYAKPSADGGDIEVVYYDSSKIIGEDAKWRDDHWEFALKGACGAYAERHDRYARAVSVLKRGRHLR